jgi:hypothetical protein
VFYKDLGLKKPQFLSRLNSRLQEMGVETIDLQRAFQEALEPSSILPYQADDTHWSAEGVRIAAELIAARLRNRD